MLAPRSAGISADSGWMSMRILASRIAGFLPRALGRGAAGGCGGVGGACNGMETTACFHHRGKFFAPGQAADHLPNGGARRKLCAGAAGRDKRILFCGREFPMYIEFARKRLNEGWELRSVDRCNNHLPSLPSPLPSMLSVFVARYLSSSSTHNAGARSGRRSWPGSQT